MKKSIKKIVLLVMVLSVLFTCFMITASAVNDTTGSWTFTYSGTKATVTHALKTTYDALVFPDTLQYKSGSTTKTYTVTAINSYFFSNSKSKTQYATSVCLPSGLTTIEQGTFNSNVSYLKTIEIPGASTTSSDYFLGCTRLTDFIVNENNTNLKAVDGVLYKGTYLQRFPVAKKLANESTVYEVEDGTTRILTYAFHEAKYITDVKIPSSVDTIRGGAFCDSNITGVHLENGSTYDITGYQCYCDSDSTSKCADRLKWCVEDEHEGIEPTCKEDGHTAGLRCDITGEWFSGEVIPMLDHSFTVFSEEKPATCTEDAVRIYKCEFNCGETDEKAIPGSAIGHKGGEATCSAPAVCGVCGESYGTVNENNHKNLITLPAVEATCKQTGLTEGKKCLDCKADTVKQTVIDMLAHKGGKATCVAVAVCENCGDGYGAVDSDAHVFAEYKYNDDATCKADGTQTAVCANGCEKTDTVKAEGTRLTHSASAPVVSGRVAPTCDKAGSYVETVRCLVCSDVLSSVNKTVPALGHADKNGDNICDNGGEKLSSPADNCKHMCHKTGFMGFIWKIVRFFQKIFKINPVCDCGVAHY